MTMSKQDTTTTSTTTLGMVHSSSEDEDLCVVQSTDVCRFCIYFRVKRTLKAFVLQFNYGTGTMVLSRRGRRLRATPFSQLLKTEDCPFDRAAFTLRTSEPNSYDIIASSYAERSQISRYIQQIIQDRYVSTCPSVDVVLHTSLLYKKGKVKWSARWFVIHQLQICCFKKHRSLYPVNEVTYSDTSSDSDSGAEDNEHVAQSYTMHSPIKHSARIASTQESQPFHVGAVMTPVTSSTFITSHVQGPRIESDEDEEENNVILLSPSRYGGEDEDDDDQDDLLEQEDDKNIKLRSKSPSPFKSSDGIAIAPKTDDSLLSQFTLRSVIAGIVVGGFMCFSNMYFGLQTGWVTMGSLQSTLLGFLFFKLLESRLTVRFNHFENVLLQTISVATATMPLAGGFVGIIPALHMLYEQDHPNATGPEPVYFSWWGLCLWAFSLAFFGVFFAVPLRKQTILVEKLKFPSGTATAQMIKVLHKLSDDQVHPEMVEATTSDYSRPDSPDEWGKKVKVLLIAFGVSSLYTLLSFFFPVIAAIPLCGSFLANNWWIYLTPSLSYVGQGMIMGTKTGASMALGAIVGWGILGPIAKSKGWAPGGMKDWKTNVKGWIMWVSLFIMLGESMVSLLVLLVQWVLFKIGKSKDSKYTNDDSADPAPLLQRVPRSWWIGGLVISSITCVAIVSPLFKIKVYETLIAIILALLTSVLAVRALGETDLNPVSGIGKISQIIFAVVAPKNVLSNLVAGAIAEAGAQQAGDMMQDLKTGHLLRASPRVQFYGQVIGSFFSVFFAVGAYKLYTYAYTSAELPAPTAIVWLDMAHLVNGGTLATNVLPFCIVASVIVSLIPIIEAIKPSTERFLPSGIAIAIGMFITPNFTFPRIVGSFVQWFWRRYYIDSHREYMIIVASGFVLGEGITSIITALLKAFT
eukprot:gene15631-18571_t